MTDAISPSGTVEKISRTNLLRPKGQGTILYLEYEEDFKGSFYARTLWGEKDKPTKPSEEYLVVGKYWSSGASA
jgi:hypothetical protein